MGGQDINHRRSAFLYSGYPIFTFGDEDHQINGTSALIKDHRLSDLPMHPTLTNRDETFRFSYPDTEGSYALVGMDDVHLFDISDDHRMIIARSVYESHTEHFMECAVATVSPKIAYWFRDRWNGLCRRDEYLAEFHKQIVAAHVDPLTILHGLEQALIANGLDDETIQRRRALLISELELDEESVLSKRKEIKKQVRKQFHL
jgi:hypothetical protein